MPRRSKKDTLHSRTKILLNAARIFRERGYEGTGLAEVMTAAGLTVGTFYAHFESKAQLFEEALIFAARTARLRMMGGVDSGKDPGAELVWLRKLFGKYLSADHCAHRGTGCPLAIFGVDVGRLGEMNRRGFETLIRRFFSEPALVEQRGQRRVGGEKGLKILTDGWLASAFRLARLL